MDKKTNRQKRQKRQKYKDRKRQRDKKTEEKNKEFRTLAMFLGQAMCPHHSDQMSQRSQVSRGTL